MAYTPLAPGATPTLGTSGDAVKALQTQLNNQNMGLPGYTPLKVDGLYGAQTQAAANYKAPTSNNITATGLTAPTQMKVVTPTPDPILSTGQNIINTALAGMPALQKTSDENTTGISTTLGRLTDLMKSDLGKSTDTAAAYETAGVNAEKANLDKYNQDLNDINANISGLANAAKAIPLQVQENNANTGATDAGVAPQTAGELRKNAIKALTQASLADIATANINNSTIRYNAAKEKAQQAIDLKYQPIEQEINFLKEQLDLNDKYITNPIEKKIAENQKIILDERDRQIADKKQAEKDVNSIMLEVAKNGGDPSKITATTPREALIQAGSSLKTPNNEIKELNGNIYAIDKTTGKVKLLVSGGVTGGVSNNPEYSGIVNTILASGKFTKDQANAIRNGVNSGQDPFTVIKNNAKNIMGSTQANNLSSLESARDAFNDFSKSLQNYYDAGGSTSLISGTFEKIYNKLGEVKDPKLVELATELAGSIQSYRHAISGTAYSNQEGKEISSIFPGINKTKELNDAIIRGRTKLFDSSIDGLYRTALGNTYDKLKNITDLSNGKGTQSDSLFVSNAINASKSKLGTYEDIVNATPSGSIPVVDNKTGEIGYIPFTEFNPTLYTKM